MSVLLKVVINHSNGSFRHTYDALSYWDKEKQVLLRRKWGPKEILLKGPHKKSVEALRGKPGLSHTCTSMNYSVARTRKYTIRGGHHKHMYYSHMKTSCSQFEKKSQNMCFESPCYIGYIWMGSYLEITKFCDWEGSYTGPSICVYVAFWVWSTWAFRCWKARVPGQMPAFFLSLALFTTALLISLLSSAGSLTDYCCSSSYAMVLFRWWMVWGIIGNFTQVYITTEWEILKFKLFPWNGFIFFPECVEVTGREGLCWPRRKTKHLTERGQELTLVWQIQVQKDLVTR